MYTLSAYPLHTIVIQRKKRKGKKGQLQISHTVSHTVHWHSNHFYRKRMSARKEVTCTYLHHTKPHILSVFHPPHSLCYLLNGRQHIGHTVPMRLQQNTTTCLAWDNKSQSHRYIGRGQSTILSKADTQPPTV